MAHTDKHDEQWFWHNHHWYKCPDHRRYGQPPAHCDICATEPRRRYYVSTASYAAWCKQERKAERGKLRHQLTKARNGRTDWDDLPCGEGKIYRRPYYD